MIWELEKVKTFRALSLVVMVRPAMNASYLASLFVAEKMKRRAYVSLFPKGLMRRIPTLMSPLLDALLMKSFHQSRCSALLGRDGCGNNFMSLVDGGSGVVSLTKKSASACTLIA